MCQTNEILKVKLNFCTTYLTKPTGNESEEESLLLLEEKLIVCACVEAIFFSALFAIIAFFKRKGLIPAFAKANELIMADEWLHVVNGCHVIKVYCGKKSKKLLTIIKDACDIEKLFIKDMFKDVTIIGLNVHDYEVYVEYCTDILLKELNEKPLFNVENPFPFMAVSDLVTNTMIFHRGSSVYVSPTIIEKEGGDNNNNIIWS